MRRLVMVLTVSLMFANIANAGVIKKKIEHIKLVTHVKKQYKVKRSTARKITSHLERMPKWKRKLKKGSCVRLSKLPKIGGKQRYKPDMRKYGRQVYRIKRLGYAKDTSYEPYVVVYGNNYKWRVRKLTQAPKVPKKRRPSASSSNIVWTKKQYGVSTKKAEKIAGKIRTMSNSRWKQRLWYGDKVRLARRRGDTGSMNKYIGDIGEIVKFSTTPRGEPYVFVFGAPGRWQVRYLRRP